jgi:lysophospholipase L1-like esterase
MIQVTRRTLITGAAALASYRALADGISGSTTRQSGGGIGFSFDGGISGAGGGSGPPPIIPGFFNFTGSNLSNWAAAKAATRNAILIPWGDSTVAGFGSVAGGSTGCVNNGWPAQLAALLSGASYSSCIASHNSTVGTIDSRVNWGSWTQDSNATFGGHCVTTAGTTTFSFTPTNQIDTIVLLNLQNTGLGTLTVNVDGGATLATVVTSGTGSMKKTTISCALGNHTINIQRTSGGSTYIHGIVAYNSAVKEISVLNGGWISGTSTNISQTGTFLTPLDVYKDYTPDLTIIEGGVINDMRGASPAVPLTTSQANLQTMITAAKVSGDAILLTPAPLNPGQAGVAPTLTVQASWVAMMKALAYSNNIPMIDPWTLFGGTYQAADMFDDLHPNGTGYGLIAGYVSSALAPGFRAA